MDIVQFSQHPRRKPSNSGLKRSFPEVFAAIRGPARRFMIPPTGWIGVGEKALIGAGSGKRYEKNPVRDCVLTQSFRVGAPGVFCATDLSNRPRR
jgi:hypothetical protein